MKNGSYFLVNPDTKSVFRFMVKSTDEFTEYLGESLEFPAIHVSKLSRKQGIWNNYTNDSWYDKWRSTGSGELAPCDQALRIVDRGIYSSDVAENIWNYLVTKGYMNDTEYDWEDRLILDPTAETGTSNND